MKSARIDHSLPLYQRLGATIQTLIPPCLELNGAESKMAQKRQFGALGRIDTTFWPSP
jgi:hypothetical protein